MDRETPQRRAIRLAFEEADRPLSPDEVLRDGRARVPGLGVATVYRALRTLQDDGWITAVDLPGEPTRYERSGKPHHHHFICRACDQAFEVDGCPGNLRPLVPSGFRLEDHEVFLYGLCSRCAA